MNIIVATDENWLIGNSKNNKLPWEVKDELKIFRKLTSEQIVVMGRKTFESLPPEYRPLPRRISCVLSRDEEWKNEQRKLYDKVYFLDSLDDVVDITYKYIYKDIFIIGGAAIYKEALSNYAESIDKIYMSTIYGKYEGDVHFPAQLLYQNFTLKKTLYSHPQFKTDVFQRKNNAKN